VTIFGLYLIGVQELAKRAIYLAVLEGSNVEKRDALLTELPVAESGAFLEIDDPRQWRG
jgi:hypothetical protein